VSAPQPAYLVPYHVHDYSRVGADTLVAFVLFTIPPTLLGSTYNSARQSNGRFTTGSTAIAESGVWDLLHPRKAATKDLVDARDVVKIVMSPDY
jgi:hypothetical protein